MKTSTIGGLARDFWKMAGAGNDFLVFAGTASVGGREAERDHAVVAQLPDPSLWIPGPTGLLHPVAHCHVGKGDA